MSSFSASDLGFLRFSLKVSFSLPFSFSHFLYSDLFRFWGFYFFGGLKNVTFPVMHVKGCSLGLVFSSFFCNVLSFKFSLIISFASILRCCCFSSSVLVMLNKSKKFVS